MNGPSVVVSNPRNDFAIRCHVVPVTDASRLSAHCRIAQGYSVKVLAEQFHAPAHRTHELADRMRAVGLAL